jgi:hypothetical protein
MEGEGPPADGDFELFPQFFNTPGNEIAPGSDIIGKYLQVHVYRYPFSRQIEGQLHYVAIVG